MHLVGFHGTEFNKEIQPKYFYGGRDFERTIFEVRRAGDTVHSEEEVRSIVAESEKRIEEEFWTGLDISEGSDTSKAFLVLVFVVGVLITVRVRFDRWEVFPHRGLDKKNQVEFVNEFLKTYSVPAQVEYTQKLSTNTQRNNPTYVAHFPLIKANSREQVLNYVTKEVHTLSEVLALTRGGDGQIFNIFIENIETGGHELYAPRPTYIGNQLTGWGTGDDPEHIAASFKKMKSARFRYLFNLYREAISEQNLDFRYARYWQILEVLAEAQNYDLNEKIYDASGTPIRYKEGGKEIRLGTIRKDVAIANAKAIVYKMLYDLYQKNSISMNLTIPLQDTGQQVSRTITYSLWERVKVWHGMRNAAAHYGGFQPADPLQEAKFNDFAVCKKFYEDIQEIGQDVLIWSLQDAVKLALPSI